MGGRYTGINVTTGVMWYRYYVPWYGFCYTVDTRGGTIQLHGSVCIMVLETRFRYVCGKNYQIKIKKRRIICLQATAQINTIE